MTPFYFGDSHAPLYGVLHEPTSGSFKSKAILICAPLGHEYFRSHRMLALLSEQLAAQGYYCLRFDYAGTGDSAGEFDLQSIERWQKNIAQAAEELSLLAGVERLDCICLRLSALLLLCSEYQTRFSNIILWDPVSDGKEYLDELAALQGRVLEYCWQFGQKRSESELVAGELLGYVYSDAIHTGISKLQLGAASFDNVSTLLFTDRRRSEQWRTLINRGDDVLFYFDQDEGLWLNEREVERSISTHGINQKILELV